MYNNVVIICDGAFPKTEYPRYLIRTADFIICCDGALKKFMRASAAIFGGQRLPDREQRHYQHHSCILNTTRLAISPRYARPDRASISKIYENSV